MELLKYIQTEPNWEERLTSNPYNLKVIKSGEYILFKYPDENPDFRRVIIREANGAIFRFDPDLNTYICVNFPFEKFGPYNKNADFIDWPSARVEQKIDGLMICVWSDQGIWHFSSQKHIDLPLKIQEILKEACGGSFKNLTEQLHPAYCYTFMLTSPRYKLVINYGQKSKLWYITRRNVMTLREDLEVKTFKIVNNIHYFKKINHPKILAAVQEALEPDESGFVVVDKKSNRVYIEGDYFSKRTRLCNEPISDFQIVKMWYDNTLSDYRKFFNEEDKIVPIITIIDNLIINLEQQYQKLWLQSNKNVKRFMAKLPKNLPCTRKYFIERQQEAYVNPEVFFRTKCTPEEFIIDIRVYIAKAALQEAIKK